MPQDTNDIWVYRIIPIQNLEHNLRHGLHCKNAGLVNPDYIPIGNQDIIGRRDIVKVWCYPDTVVNDYVPFYFSVRTPMLLNIKTGRGVPAKPQEEIIYLCFRIADLTTTGFQWCFTDGNAAKQITRFFCDLKHLDHLDWRSINTTDFKDGNADGDEDRVRKKHAEFLVRSHVPVNLLRKIVVKTTNTQKQVEAIVAHAGLTIPVHINPKFYF
jgi:hypothetical protein